MKTTIRPFGHTSGGQEVSAYCVENSAGMRVEMLTYGATVRLIELPGKINEKTDVVLGYDSILEYEKGRAYFGAAIGRNANRIAKGRFYLCGKPYQLETNDGPNHLHGGFSGFHNRIWEAAALEDGVQFTYRGPDGEGGYPGELTADVRYRLREDNILSIAYRATSPAPTLVNMTNHSYFNLAGHDCGSILSQRLTIEADYYLPADQQCLPTGEIHRVKDTPMDFTAPKEIGQDINSAFIQLKQFNGYDHTYALRGDGNAFYKAATLYDQMSGRRLEVYTDLPGMQLYTANGTNETGKNGTHYKPHSAVCFETQFFPDCINMRHFEGPALLSGQTYQSRTEYRFFY